MRAIRNFIYNFSDIFVAIIIVAIAVVLIGTRLNVIMSYPDTDEPTGIADTQSADTEGDAGLDPNVEYITVSIPGGSSTDVVAGILKEGSVITDTDAFINELRLLGMDGQVQAGTHYIPKGSTLDEMINIICGKTAEGEAQPAEGEAQPAEGQ